MANEKTKTISFRVTALEKIEFLNRSRESNMCISDWVVVQLDKAEKYEKIEPILKELARDNKVD